MDLFQQGWNYYTDKGFENVKNVTPLLNGNIKAKGVYFDQWTKGNIVKK